jgi:hypothetical protein
VNGQELIDRLKRELGVRTNTELARRLGVTTAAVGYWSKTRALTARQLVALLMRVMGPTGDDIVSTLCRRLRVANENQLAPQLGLTAPALYAWRDSLVVTARQVANLVESARDASAKQLATRGIRPVVEFYPIERTRSRRGRSWQLFDVTDEHPYREGLRQELMLHHGVYLFSDSRGRVIYAGKARRLRLWHEMSSAFNRAREVQSIKRVRHPERRQKYRTNEETVRQITATQVSLSELASYFSAYEVHEELIDELEALLVRSFANDLSNVRMERFGCRSHFVAQFHTVA